jgi:hypothetical protein
MEQAIPPYLPVEIWVHIVELGGAAMIMAGRSVCKAWRDILVWKVPPKYGAPCRDAVVVQSLELLKWLIDNGCFCNISSLKSAIKLGVFDVLQYLLSLNVFSTHKYLKYCTRYHQICALDLLEKWYTDQKFLTVIASRFLLESAIRRGARNIIEWCCNRGVIPMRNDSIQALANGNIDLYYWLREFNIDSSAERLPIAITKRSTIASLALCRMEGVAYSKETCLLAARYGRLDLLEYLYSEFGFELESGIYYEAALGGHLHIIKWAQKHGCPPSDWILLHALHGGNPLVIEYIDKNFPNVGELHYPFDHAVHGGVWAMEYVFQKKGILPNERTLQISINRGMAYTTQWLLNHGVTPSEHDSYSVHMDRKMLQVFESMKLKKFVGKANSNNPRLLRILHELGYPIGNPISYRSFSIDLNVIKYFCEHGIADKSCLSKFLYAAVINGNLPAVQYLMASGAEWESFLYDRTLFLGNIHIMLWAHTQNYPKKPLSLELQEELQGNMILLGWLTNNGFEFEGYF